MDTRSNKAIACSGCFLHQSLMAEGCAVAPNYVRPFVEWAMDKGVGLVPWTCPETMFKGLPRKSMGFTSYGRAGLKEASTAAATEFAKYLRLQRQGGVNIIALVGVAGSPACSAGWQIMHGGHHPGHYVQALTDALHAIDIDIPLIDVNRSLAPEKIKARLDKAIAGCSEAQLDLLEVGEASDSE